MNGTAPLLRSVANVAHQASSRIPHIRFHIATRQARPQSLKQNTSQTSLPRRRYQSTTVHPDYVETADIDRKRRSHGAEHKLDLSSIQGAEGNIYNETIHTKEDLTTTTAKNVNMFDILVEGLPDRILSGLMSDSIGSPFIRQADVEIFNKALLALDPDYFIEPFKDITRHSKGPSLSQVLQSRTIDDRLATFAAWLDHIVSLRRTSGWTLNLEACNHLLRCAASMGDAPLARSILKKIMPADGVTPDLDTYNYYCKALVWSHAFSSAEQYNMRVIPRHLEIRAARNRPRGLSGYATANAKRGIDGVRQEVLDIFKESMAKDHAATELTFINLMIAMGREADLEGVKSILKSVWNIDINLLGVYDEEEIESPTFYDEGHALRPSEDILYAVAHIFGTNNDVRMAWLLVDYISRNYDLGITQRVWLHLCEWAFVLTLRRSGQGRRQGRDSGQITQETFTQLVEVMTDAPHNINLSSTVHSLLCRSWRDQHHLDNAVHHARELARIVDRRRDTMRQLGEEVLEYAQNARTVKRPDAFACEEFYNLRQRYALQFYEFQRDLQLANIAVARNILQVSEWAGSGKLCDWERRKLPSLVNIFIAYTPAVVTYQTQTGTVELVTKYKRMIKNSAAHVLDVRTIPRIFNAMDTADQMVLNRRMEALPTVIVRAKSYCYNCESIGHTTGKCPNKPFASSTLDYKGEPCESGKDTPTDDILVLNPDIPRRSVPYAFDPGAEEEHADPRLPFR